jgi:putative addiction module component (TIGR02574 family)
MSKVWSDLRDKALELSPEERGWIAESLWDSVRTEEEREVEAAWIPEIKRRIAEIEAGTAELIDSDEVFAELRAKYGADKVSR